MSSKPPRAAGGAGGPRKNGWWVQWRTVSASCHTQCNVQKTVCDSRSVRGVLNMRQILSPPFQLYHSLRHSHLALGLSPYTLKSQVEKKNRSLTPSRVSQRQASHGRRAGTLASDHVPVSVTVWLHLAVHGATFATFGSRCTVGPVAPATSVAATRCLELC